jgi:DNA-directed RNA polymerase subunit RPC12/RpoP
MTAAGAIFLIAVGAILRYATNVHVEGVSLDTVGLILMIAGLAGLIIGLGSGRPSPAATAKGRSWSKSGETFASRRRVTERLSGSAKPRLDIGQPRVAVRRPTRPRRRTMFRCERCGSRYSSMHAAAIENCPRCLVREKVSSPLAFQAFQLPNRSEGEPASGQEERQEQGQGPTITA